MAAPQVLGEEQHQGDGRERHRRLGEPDDEPGPMTLGKLLRRREDHARLREPHPEQQVEVPRLPHPRLVPAREAPQQHERAEQQRRPAPGAVDTNREGARLLGQLPADRRGRGAHGRPFCCSDRT